MFPGVDYNAREMYNMHLDNDYYAGKLHEEEYRESRIPEGMLWPEGGRVAEPRVLCLSCRQPCRCRGGQGQLADSVGCTESGVPGGFDLA